ncbi:unnamed protein product [Cyclocybe aegerita]|uniref:Glycosyltransferase family 28 N-terminal domain-containing protein n=1 Tax=Cyclocybe aegerita TaxID=1973307 RepID=A0A8S0X0P0_CYCAE|nr:unnamed protein product [Cyclocybe aegerita]
MPSSRKGPLHMLDVADHVELLPEDRTTTKDRRRNTLYVKVSEDGLRDDRSIDYSEYISKGKGLKSVASLRRDGRISVLFDLKDKVPDIPNDHARDIEEFGVDQQWRDCPILNIVIMIVGSRGDVQPYLALGKQLAKDGHRVRVATHETFRSFVGEAGLEFYSIGGNPQDLMSYMVKSALQSSADIRTILTLVPRVSDPGLLPGFESLTNGDIRKNRKMLTEMIQGCWLSCNSPCPDTGRAFAADAIISNPPAFAHIHCAEALGIPLLMSFTMPWTPTTAFVHPLVSIINSNAGSSLSNYLSYAAADLLTWQGIGDIINTFRTSTLGLSPLTLRSGPNFLERAKVPWTYCMSPSLVPKPYDWKNHIDVVGFYFLDLASNYQPPRELREFLEAGGAPVYIGFGSVVVDDPAAMSQIIFEATQIAGVRALVSVGWARPPSLGGLGGVSAPPNIFMLGNVPHDWLFDNERVCAVVHHGGAGTTAIGLAKGRPTVVVPFFGDQGFWGSMIHKAGAGPKPIHHKELTAQNLAEAIMFATSPQAKRAARNLARNIRDEDGVRKGVESFYRHLPLLNMRCDLDPSRLAVWWATDHCMKLSAFAAQTLADTNMIDMRSLTLHRPREYRPRNKSTSESPSGLGTNIFWSLTHAVLPSTRPSHANPESPPEPTQTGIMSAMASMHEGLMNPVANQPISPRSSANDELPHHRTYSAEKKSPTSPSARDPRRQRSRAETIITTVTDTVIKIMNVAKHPQQFFFSLPLHPSAWKSIQSPAARVHEHRPRLTRIAAGREDVRHSTAAQRAHIIKRFEEESRLTPMRQKLYREAVRRATKDGMEDDATRSNTSGGSSINSSGPSTSGTGSASPTTRLSRAPATYASGLKYGKPDCQAPKTVIREPESVMDNRDDARVDDETGEDLEHWQQVPI